VSELYSIDPFHEGSLPGGVTNETCYPNIMVELDNYFNGVSQEDKAKNNVDEQPKWIIQYWQGVPQSGAFSAMSKYGNRFIGLDLFADNIYADNAAKWRTNYYNGRPYVYCMLHNFGGRSGLHGRLETTMNGYFEALAKGNNMQGVGATPEGIETNPILYDMLFELPWMDAKDRPTVDEWMADYAHARYGINNATALAALQNLKKSVWNCRVNQQGTSEAVILARPNWTVKSVSSWSTSAIYWDTQDVRLAADQLCSIEELVTTADGKTNYDYDFIDVVRQAMVDYAAELLPLINSARNSGDTAEY
jgi:alpha-N-acetylglucosaminidase